MSRYPRNGSWAVEQLPLVVGQRVQLFDDSRRWWTIQAVTDHFAAAVRQAEFHPAGVYRYTVLDWRNGVRGPCDLVGQAWGDGSYTEAECAQMLARFEAGALHVSQRNWMPLQVTAVQQAP